MITEWYHPDALKRVTLFPTTMTKPWEIAWMLWKLGSTPGNVLEIGAHHGETTREFALAFPEKIIYAVEYPDNASLSEFQRQDLPQPSRACEAATGLPNVKVLLQDSRMLDYSALIDIGFVFIDGDHSFEGVRGDSEKAWGHFSERPGVIVWHDCYPHEHIAVHAFLSMLSQRWPTAIKQVAGTSMAFAEF